MKPNFKDAARAARLICMIESKTDSEYNRFGKDWSPLGKDIALGMEIIDTAAAYLAASIPRGPARARVLHLLSDAQSNMVHAFAEAQDGRYKNTSKTTGVCQVGGLEKSAPTATLGVSNTIPFPISRLLDGPEGKGSE
jgi:hypothetical protein